MRILVPALLLFVAAVVGCESTPRPKSAAPVEAPARPSVELDGAVLVAQAEALRDREFSRAPTLVRVAELEDSPLPGCAGRCDEERRWLTTVLFGGQPPPAPVPLARWDAAQGAVLWDGRSSDTVAVRAAVLAELVRALDGLADPQATSWDAYLAAWALRRGPGVFVATLDRARARQSRVDAARLAARPEGLYELDLGSARFADAFTTREGFAFTAAMVRSGGWSTLELAQTEAPATTLQIVRPDRYLRGEQAAQWELPSDLNTARVSAGFDLALEGAVGPALFVEWLGQRVPAAAARTAYVAYEADHYRVYQADGGRWAFEWVTLWSSPSAAEQIVAALDAGLRQRSDGAVFSVLRKGATVAVVGESTRGPELALRGAALVELLPVFPAARPRGVEFVPTPVDRLHGRPAVTSVAPTQWVDAASGVTVDLGALGPDWQTLPTTEPNLPWFSKHASGAVLQYLVQPEGLLDPPFVDQAYADAVRERFVRTMELSEPATVTRADQPTPGAIVIDVVGKIRDRTAEGPVHLRAWHFAAGPFVTTLSLQAPPDRFAELIAELSPLLASIAVPGAAEASAPGVIEFKVEE